MLDAGFPSDALPGAIFAIVAPVWKDGEIDSAAGAPDSNDHCRTTRTVVEAWVLEVNDATNGQTFHYGPLCIRSRANHYDRAISVNLPLSIGIGPGMSSLHIAAV